MTLFCRIIDEPGAVILIASGRCGEHCYKLKPGERAAAARSPGLITNHALLIVHPEREPVWLNFDGTVEPAARETP